MCPNLIPTTSFKGGCVFIPTKPRAASKLSQALHLPTTLEAFTGV